MAVIGNQARFEILHQLRDAGPLTAAELAVRVGATRAAVLGHLKHLEGDDLVSADIPPERRTGRTVRWTVSRERIQAMLDELSAYVLPRD